jgi:hypothetical protein
MKGKGETLGCTDDNVLKSLRALNKSGKEKNEALFVI